MNIIEIKELSNGVQERPYADHIYKWSIEVTGKTDEKEMLEFCQKYLKDCKYDHDYYRNHLDDPGTFFSGYYSLHKNSLFDWTYSVRIPCCD